MMQILADVRNAVFFNIPTHDAMTRWERLSRPSVLSLLSAPQPLGEIHEGGVALVTKVERSLCGPALPPLCLVVPLRPTLLVIPLSAVVALAVGSRVRSA